MRKTHLFIGLTILLWGISLANGQEILGIASCDPCKPTACEPCEPLCDPCDPCDGKSGLFLPFTFGGWVETGIYGNGHDNRGRYGNGSVFSASHARTDIQMNQLYLFGEKEMNTRRGFDWGGRIDLAYGTDYDVMQTFDGEFDAGWGVNKSGYGMAAYQLYGTLGYKDLSVKIGKFAGCVGWEAVPSKDNFFYSHSFCYMIEPATHTGVLATYDLSDRLSLNAGWTTGADSSFKNPYGNSAVLTGFTYALSDNANIHYWINAGKQHDFAFELGSDYFVQSLCLEWALTERFDYVLQYNLRNDNIDNGSRLSAYGINNHFLYKLTDNLSTGMRVEWHRNKGGDGFYYLSQSGDYWNVTLGLRWDVTDHLSFRPEIRYDWCRDGAVPFNNGTSRDQVSGGGGMIVSF